MSDNKNKIIFCCCAFITLICLLTQIYQKYCILQIIPTTQINDVQSQTIILKQKILKAKNFIKTGNNINFTNINNEIQTLIVKNNCRLTNASSTNENESSIIFTGSLKSILNCINGIYLNNHILILKIDISDNIRNKIVSMVYKIK